MSFPLFYQPITSLFDDIEIDLIGRDVGPSHALRKAGTSTRSMGGTLLNGTTYREFGYDSELERQCTLQSMQEPDVADVAGQHVQTWYYDPEGNRRHTIWDLLITRKNGTRELISVKRYAVASSNDYQIKWGAICAGVEPGVADIARIFSERCLDPAKVDRGGLYNKVLAGGQPTRAEPAYDFITAQQRPVVIEAACEFLRTRFPVLKSRHFYGLSAEFWAIIWLLAQGAIAVCTDGFLTMQSMVVRS